MLPFWLKGHSLHLRFTCFSCFSLHSCHVCNVSCFNFSLFHVVMCTLFKGVLVFVSPDWRFDRASPARDGSCQHSSAVDRNVVFVASDHPH